MTDTNKSEQTTQMFTILIIVFVEKYQKVLKHKTEQCLDQNKQTF